MLLTEKGKNYSKIMRIVKMGEICQRVKVDKKSKNYNRAFSKNCKIFCNVFKERNVLTDNVIIKLQKNVRIREM